MTDLPPTFKINAAGENEGLLTVDTVGDLEPGPQDYIPGSARGAIPEQFTTSARRVYPHYGQVTIDTTNNPATATFDTNSSLSQIGPYPATFGDAAPADFPNWHSAFQAEFIMTARSKPPGS